MKRDIEFDALQKFWLTPPRVFDFETLRALKYSGDGGYLLELQKLYAGMFAEWDTLRKDVTTLMGAVAALDWRVVPYVEKGKKPDAKAQKVADVVSRAIWARGKQKPGTYAHTFLQMVGAMAVDGLTRGVNVHELLLERLPDGTIAAPFYGHVFPNYYMWENRDRHDDRLMLVRDGMSFSDPEPFPENKFIIALNTQGSDHPMYNSVYASLLGYFGAAKWGLPWLQEYCRRYGHDIKKFTVKTDEQENRLREQLAQGDDPTEVFLRDGADMEVTPIPGAAGNPYEVLLKIAENHCHQAILGQTLTSDTGDSGGSRAQAEVHMGVQKDVVLHYAEYAAGVLNAQLIPALVELNFGKGDVPMPELQFSIPDGGVSTEVAQYWQAVLQIPGMRVAKEEVYESLRISMPADGADVFETPGAAAAGEGGTMPHTHGKQSAPQGGEGKQQGEDDDDDPEPPDNGGNKPKDGGDDDAGEVTAANPYGCNQFGEGWAAPHNGTSTSINEDGKKEVKKEGENTNDSASSETRFVAPWEKVSDESGDDKSKKSFSELKADWERKSRAASRAATAYTKAERQYRQAQYRLDNATPETTAAAKDEVDKAEAEVLKEGDAYHKAEEAHNAALDAYFRHPGVGNLSAYFRLKKQGVTDAYNEIKRKKQRDAYRKAGNVNAARGDSNAEDALMQQVDKMAAEGMRQWAAPVVEGLQKMLDAGVPMATIRERLPELVPDTEALAEALTDVFRLSLGVSEGAVAAAQGKQFTDAEIQRYVDYYHASLTEDGDYCAGRFMRNHNIPDVPHEQVMAFLRRQKEQSANVEAENPYGCNQFGEGWSEPHEGNSTSYQNTNPFSGEKKKVLTTEEGGRKTERTTDSKRVNKSDYDTTPDDRSTARTKARENMADKLREDLSKKLGKGMPKELQEMLSRRAAFNLDPNATFAAMQDVSKGSPVAGGMPLPEALTSTIEELKKQEQEAKTAEEREAAKQYRGILEKYLEKVKSAVSRLLPSSEKKGTEKTRGEAIKKTEELGKQATAYPDAVVVDFNDSISVEQINRYNEALERLLNKYPGANVTEFGSMFLPKGGIIAATSFKPDVYAPTGIKLNHDNKTEGIHKIDRLRPIDKEEEQRAIEKLEASLDAVEEKKEREKIQSEIFERKYRKKFNRNIVGTTESGLPMENVIFHEWGHALHSPLEADAKTNKESQDAVSAVHAAMYKAVGNGDIYKISKYAGSSHKEFFAECFSAHVSGEKLPNYIVEMIDKVQKRAYDRLEEERKWIS